MSKQNLLRELQELLDELFTPVVPKNSTTLKGGPRK